MTEHLIADRVRIVIEGSVAHVILSRPDKHNGMDMEMLQAVNTAAGKLKANRDVRAVILRGDGPSFCAGLDFKTVMGKPAKAALAYSQLWWPTRNDFQSWSMAWREVGVPVIAAIHGNCFGAGIQLALGADIRFATSDAKISIMESKWGLVPDMGGVALMRDVLRQDDAKELTFTGRIISGDEAEALGLVTHVADDPVAAAQALAEEIAVRSPDATAAAKHLLHEGWHGSDDAALSAERRWQRRVMGGKNQRLAVKANMSKQAPTFAARRLK